MNRVTKTLLAVAVGSCVLGQAIAAPSLGVNFVGRDNANSTLQSTDTAGVVPQPNWNNVAGEPFAGTTTLLDNSDGAFTLVTLNYACNDSWRNDNGATTTADDKLMKGIMKANPDPDSQDTNDSSRMVFTLQGLTAGTTHDVIVYLSNNGSGAQADVTLGATTYYTTIQDNWAGAYVQGTATTAAGRADANYVRFSNVGVAANGTIAITVQKRDVPQITDGIGVSALQLVPVTGEIPINTIAPQITGGPDDSVGVVGGTTSFTVVINGPWNVQWQSSTDDGANWAAISGANGTTYTTGALVAGDAGTQYRAIITNNIGTITSSAVTLVAVDPVGTPMLTQGVIPIAHYAGINGTVVYDPDATLDGGTDLYNTTKYQNRTPDRTFVTLGLNLPDAGEDNFGRTGQGWFRAPSTGSYRFFLRSDDGSELHISLNNTIPAQPEVGLELRAEERGCCAAFEEPGAGGNGNSPETFPTSDPISMTVGQDYGFLVAYKEGGGGDFLQVAVRKEGDATAASALQPISPEYLWGMADPAGHRSSITAQPQDAEQQENRRATFTVSASVLPVTDPIGAQWYRDGTLIPGATQLSYTTPALNVAADNGAVFHAKLYTLAGVLLSESATLTVVPDTFPPLVMGVGALVNTNGTTIDVGIGFDEKLDPASAGAMANYNVSAGTIASVRLGGSTADSVLLKVTGLNPGDSATVTVNGVKDILGNTMTTAATKSFTVDSVLKWGVVGAAEQASGNYVIPVGANSFDVYSDGVTEWGSYDEATFVYEPVTGDFDKKLRVEYQDNSSQWARAGLIVREDLTVLGMARATAEGGEAGRYQKLHVNPRGPTLTGPGTDGNNGWETNRRITKGAATTDAGGGGGGPVPYPTAWCRIQRSGDDLILYRSSNGEDWTQIATTTMDPPLPETVYVGPEYSPENGNITNVGDRGTFLAKIRDYGDTFPATGDRPTVIVSNDGTDLTLEWTGGGVLQSTTNPADGASWQTIDGAATGYSEPMTGTKYFQVVQ